MRPDPTGTAGSPRAAGDGLGSGETPAQAGRRRTILVGTTLAVTHGTAVASQAQTLADAGYRVIGVGHGLPGWPLTDNCYEATFDLPRPRAGSPLSLARSVLAFRRICVRERPDLVWLHTSLAAAVGRVAVLTIPRARRPLVAYLAYAFYCESADRSLSLLLYRVIEWLLSMTTDHLQTVNREDYERARRLSGRTASNTELTRGIGIDVDRLLAARADRDEVRAELGLGPDDRAVFVIGALTAQKRVGDALRAVSALGDGTRLFIVGEGPALAGIDALAGRLGGVTPVHLPSQADHVRLLSAADVLLHPSSREGLPTVVLEAQTLGVPVVGARVRGTTDLLGGGAGILVPVGDVPAMTAGLRAVLDDPHRRQAVIEAGRARADQHRIELATFTARSIGHLLLDRDPVSA